MEQIPLKWDEKQCGIYCIKNLVSDKVYIGSSKNCYHRVRSQHFDKLRLGTHSNPHLQASWNQYGKSSFESFCVELCGEDILVDREQVWIDKTGCLDRNVGYNINPYADRVELTDEQCRKITLSKLGSSRGVGGVYQVKNRLGTIVWKTSVRFRGEDFYIGTFQSKSVAEKMRNYVIGCLKENEQIDWDQVCSCRINHKKKVVQKNVSGDVIGIYESIQEACGSGGFRRAGIRACCQGRRKAYRGFVWKFI